MPEWGVMPACRLPLKLTALAVVSCSFLAGPAAGTASASVCAGASANPVETSRTDLSRTTLCLVNSQRSARGLHKLRLNPRLSKAARAHSGDMVAKHYFDHVSKSGKDVVDRLYRTGYLGDAQSWTVGENLAWGSGSYGTPKQILRSWMNSAGHRQNILTGRFREIGIGVVDGTPANRRANGATYTTTFGARAGVDPPKPRRLGAKMRTGQPRVSPDSPWAP